MLTSIVPSDGLPNSQTSSDSCRVPWPSGFAHDLNETSFEHQSRFASLVECASWPRIFFLSARRFLSNSSSLATSRERFYGCGAYRYITALPLDVRRRLCPAG